MSPCVCVVVCLMGHIARHRGHPRGDRRINVSYSYMDLILSFTAIYSVVMAGL